MKFSTSTLLALVVMTSGASATHVFIKAECTGVDFSKLPIMEDVYVGNLLGESFNNVHGSSDDDSHLSHVNFGLHQDASTELGFYFGWNGSYGCIGCRRILDDDDFDDNVAATTAADDNNMVDETHQKLWNAEFASLLVKSGRPDFAKVGACQIHMEPDLDAEDQDDEEEQVGKASTSDVHVTIEVKCDGVDFPKIPLSQDIYVGNVLQRTFNKVHGDDERLSNVKFGLMKSFYLESFFGWNGDYGCIDCQRDDSLHGKWEAEFSKALETSEHKDLVKAKKCSITMKAPMAEEETVGAIITNKVAVPKKDDQPSMEGSIVYVHISTSCGGVDFDKLPISQDEFAGYALQDSYNKVHSDDDATLKDISYGKNRKSDGLGFYYGWKGTWGCVGCRRILDDDDFDDNVATLESRLFTPHHGEWEKEFETMLLNSKHKEFARIKNCKIHMAVNVFDEQGTEQAEQASEVAVITELDQTVDAGSVHVLITAYCQGVDFADLPLAEDEFAGHALEDSFNSVHGSSDKRLTQVQYGSHAFAGSEVEFYYGWNGSYGCVGCRQIMDDDDDFFKKDMVSFANNDPILRGHTEQWENEFANALLTSGRKHFNKVGQCKIHMKADLGTTTATVVTSLHLANVNIDIDCHGIDMKKLTLEEDILIAHALEYSFNSVHVGNDDSELEDVIYGEYPEQDQLGLYKGWKGSYNCQTCTEDEDMLRSKKKSAMQAAWEAEFTKKLIQSKHSTLNGAKSCSISMTVPSSLGQTTVKCGLRACAES